VGGGTPQSGRRIPGTELKPVISDLLRARDYRGLIRVSKKDRSVMRHLLALTYEKKALLSRRAIKAIGRITAEMSPEAGRRVIQRVLWMMRDDSGGSMWSGPEILGEIVRGNPEAFEDIVPIIASFHEEEFFRAGVLRALKRIGAGSLRYIGPNRPSPQKAKTASRRS